MVRYVCSRLPVAAVVGMMLAALGPAGSASASSPVSAVASPLDPASAVVTPAGPAAPPAAPPWVATWAASPQDLGNPNFSGTVRNIVFTAVGGNTVRVRFTNTFGQAPLQIGAAAIGVSGNDGAVPGPNVPLTFGGKSSITIPQGAEALSDPVQLTVSPLSDLAVSVYVPVSGEQSGHSDAQQTSYAISGVDNVLSPNTAGDFTVGSWYFVDSVDVTTQPSDLGTVVALGDSITDGYQSTPNTNARWPNDLARRFAATPGKTMSVVDEGISGNEILQNLACCGVSALARFDRDVVDRAGVKDVILLEGVNDIGNNEPTAGQLIAGIKQLIAQAHAAGLKIFGGTITPFKGAGYWTPQGEATREAVNRFIRTSGAFDGVINFAHAVAAPNNPKKLNPIYDSGDHLHPNDSGYQAMANAIDLPALIQAARN